MVRASDAPTYVQYGAADPGVAGKDVLLSMVAAVLPRDLQIARCRMMVAVPDDSITICCFSGCSPASPQISQTARDHLPIKGYVDHQTLRLDGACPLVGLAMPSSTSFQVAIR